MRALRLRALWAFTAALSAGVHPLYASPPTDPLIASPRAAWDRDKAAHLLRRAGFGGTPEQIQHAVRLGRDKAVSYLIDYESIQQTDPDFPADRFPVFPPRRAFAGLKPEDRREIEAAVRRIGINDVTALQDFWLRRMVVTPRPLEEKMTLFWHGHFTSGFREVRRPGFLYRQNAFLRANALGEFRTIVRGISRDPAMLLYLDNGKNVKAHPNENYARELMELFTLGEGNYTEQDVKEAARAFTGWTATPEGEFIIRPRQHDDGTKTFLGKTGHFGGDDIIDIIFEQPAAARFLARKLWRFYVEPNPDPALIEALADRIRVTNYSLRETMGTIFRSDAFYEPRARFALIKSPAELLVSSAHLLDVPLDDLRTANQAMNAMGQELFQPPNVKGWDGGRSWITTSTLFLRYNAMKGLLDGTRPRDRGRDPRVAALLRKNRPSPRSRAALQTMQAMQSESDRAGREPLEMQAEETPLANLAEQMKDLPEPVREWLRNLKPPPRFSRPQPAYDPEPTLSKYRLTTPEEVVDHYVRRLLQMPLPPDRRKVLLEALAPDGQRFDLRSPQAAERIRAMIHLILSMPEYQLD